ncbi:hypothetical protein R2103_13270 [Nitrosomonas sp. Is24]|uniref:hypothetical protein n=1 Tax=Nitrosomonas sp. Is24 TaxID=3080533 RepID=UPI00294AD0D2|nr:hypothetical protein [Nitrosomonas sp. Is24]MDV6342740.1 hypothetical protein [Nitrosomonas sp. Is24]
MPYNFNASDLTSEKSLWQIYKLSRKIQPSKLHVFIIILTMILLGTNAYFLEDDISIILNDTRTWASMGFNFSISTLGFLIAGFTIFATISKPEMMLAMMGHINKETGLPTLKYNFFAFMQVFIVYIVFALIYLLVMILGQKSGFLANIVNFFPYSSLIKLALIKTSYVIIGSSFVYLLLLLKVFVFNVYAIVMNFLRWEYHNTH